MPFPSLRIGELEARVPIIQGGMGIGVSLSGLASAVAQAGGIGVIAAAGIGFGEPDYRTNHTEANSRAMRRNIREVRRRTSGLLGINIMTAITNYAEMVAVAEEEGADIIFSGAGLPKGLPGLVSPGATIKLVPIVSSGRAAELLCRSWLHKHDRLPDAFVVEGPMAGGHLGFRPEQIHDPAYSLDRLLPDVLAAVAPYAAEAGREIPVIVAGGVYTGADIHRYLQMGASGVQMGTRFVVTHECDASPRFKQAYLDCREEDIVIVQSPVGMPGRAIRNSFVSKPKASTGKPLPCGYRCLKGCDPAQSPYCITLALVRAQRGDIDQALVFAGQNAHRVKAIVSVRELLDELEHEYELRAGLVDAVTAASGDSSLLYANG